MAFADDWQVRRSSGDNAEREARALATLPVDGARAARLIHRLNTAQIETLLQRFERRAAARPNDFVAQLASAQVLLAAGRWSDAAARFGRAAGLSPDLAAPRWGRARALSAGGDSRAAVTEFRLALGLARGATETSRMARELITVSVAVGDVEAELEARRAWTQARPTADVTFELALALGRAGRPAEGAAILAGATKLVGRTVADRIRWGLEEGTLRAAAGDLDGALLTLGRARREIRGARDEQRNELWSKTIEIARRRGTLDDIKAELAHPSDGIEWQARARISDECGDLPEAWAAFDEAIRRSPRDVDLRRRRIAIAQRIGGVGKLVGLYEELAASAAKVDSDAAEVIGEALDGLWRLGRSDEAGRVFDQALARRRGGTSLSRALAEAAGRWGDDRRAERAWAAVLRGKPRDEMAIVALGEAQFQRGQRRLAVETWRRLLSGRGTSAQAHQRLGELLGEHEFLELALAEARTAVALLPTEARHHRLLATILERQAKTRPAEGEWETVLRLAAGSGRAPERHEARAHLIALWVREGPMRVEAKLRELEQSMGRNDGDLEPLRFLVEAQLRTGRTDAAIAAMKGALTPRQIRSGASDSGTGAARVAPMGSGATADMILLLVRTLRQARRSEEATSWLEELARRFPERARDTRLQLVDIALAAHSDQRAREVAEQMAADAPGDPRVMARVAAVQERLGQFDQARSMYGRLNGIDRDPAAALALATLLGRMGETSEQRTLLREALRTGGDDEVITEIGRRAIVLEEAGGTLEALEAYVADGVDLDAASPGGPARRRVLASLLLRLIPPAYRSQSRDAAARATLRRLARHGMRPLLDLVSAPDTQPDVRAIEALGMLGRVEAIPHLAHVVIPDIDSSDSTWRSTTNAPTPPRDEVVSVAVIALGRLGGEAARAAIETIARNVKPTLRLPVLWALGRVGGALAVQVARDEIAHGTTGAAIVSCLTLGRVGGAEGASLLESIAEDPARAEPVRVAAITGLGLGRHTAVVPRLSGLVDGGDTELAAAARTALRRLAGPDPTLERDESVVGSEPDEAVAIFGGQVDPDALLEALVESVAPPRSENSTRRAVREPSGGSAHSAP